MYKHARSLRVDTRPLREPTLRPIVKPWPKSAEIKGTVQRGGLLACRKDGPGEGGLRLGVKPPVIVVRRMRHAK